MLPTADKDVGADGLGDTWGFWTQAQTRWSPGWALTGTVIWVTNVPFGANAVVSGDEVEVSQRIETLLLASPHR